MTIILNGTTGITNDGGYTGDGVVFADTTPANTLVTTTGGNVGIGTSSTSGYKVAFKNGAKSQFFTTDASSSFYYTDGNFYFGTTGADNVVAVTNNAERMRIDSSGNLLVGATGRISNERFSAQSSGNAEAGLFSSSGTFATVLVANYYGSGTRNFIQFRVSSTDVGNITSAGSTTSYNTTSDYRLKENVQPMMGALSVVQQLKPCTYTWKADGSDGQGFIAHELQAVVPDAVVGEKDAIDEHGNPKYQGIDTSFLVATLTAAIQEQQAIILAQESALTALTARVSALEGAQHV